MDNQKPSEQIQIDQETETALKKRLLEQYSPPDMDNTMLRMIENEWALLTDELFFDLLRETPSWLRMEFFIKKIAEWQYIAGNDVFDAEMRKKAKENINEIPVALLSHLPEPKRGRPQEIPLEVLYKKYISYLNSFTAFEEKNQKLPENERKSFFEEYPQFEEYFGLKPDRRRHRTPHEWAIHILAKQARVSERSIYTAIKEHSK